MTGPQRVYTSTVVAPGHVVAATLIAITLGALPVLAAGTPWPPAAAAVLVVLTGIHLGTVRLTVTRERIVIGQGPWARPARVIATSAVTRAHAECLTFPQISGFGIPFHRATTRLTIRPGPTLTLLTRSGEHIRVSTAHPEEAAALITGWQPAGTRRVPGTPREGIR